MYPLAQKPLHPLYDRQIIFLLVDHGQDLFMGDKIRKKSDRKYRFSEETKVVSLVVRAENRIDSLAAFSEACKRIDHRTRIYINSHCTIGSNSLSTDKRQLISSDYLAGLFAQYISRGSSVFRSTGDQQLKISLSGCYAGSPSTQLPIPVGCVNNSFAARFSAELKRRSINCRISARLGAVIVSTDSSLSRFNVVKPDMSERAKKLLLARNTLILKQHSSFISDSVIEKKLPELLSRKEECYYSKTDKAAKAIYSYNDRGIQEVRSAYDPDDHGFLPRPLFPMDRESELNCFWFNEVVETIYDCIKELGIFASTAKKKAFYDLLDYVLDDGRTVSEIYETINKELSSSVMKTYNINLTPKICDKFRIILNKYNKIIAFGSY